MKTGTAVDWRFVALFLGVGGALYLGYCAIPDSFLRDHVYFYGIVRPAEALINWIVPTEHALGVQNRIESASARLNIVRGCDGAGIAFLLIAAILAYRAHLKATLLGITGAVLLVYVLNEMRVIVLYFLITRRPDWFLTAHVYLIPTLMILVGTIYFSLWSARLSHALASPAAP